MRKSWQDVALWAVGSLVVVLGIVFPVYLFKTEGCESVFGDTVFVIAGQLLLLAGLGIAFFRAWLMPSRRSADASAG